ncbi:hypothetical protein [Eubacterium sp.]
MEANTPESVNIIIERIPSIIFIHDDNDSACHDTGKNIKANLKMHIGASEIITFDNLGLFDKNPVLKTRKNSVSIIVEK